MGTTLDALNAGSLTYCYVVAIEGYNHLLTTALFDEPFDAWNTTDWGPQTTLRGLFVELDNQGSANPWDPFQPGGTCTLRVVPDFANGDEFGIATHRKLLGAETYLTATVDRDDTTINVASTSGFASSGFAFIGTECFSYTSVSSTQFLGCTRGRYSPFFTATGTPWAEHHRVGAQTNRVNLSPIVSAFPRTWVGKWVGVWLHRVQSFGATVQVVDDKSQAQLVYAGKITEVRDDASGATVVQLKHVMDTLRETVVGRDQWQAEVADGLYLRSGFGGPIRMIDYNDFPSGRRTSATLQIVPSGATGSNQVNEGYYTVEQICDFMTNWLAAQTAAGNLYGTYSMGSPIPSPEGLRSKIYYRIPATGSKSVTFRLEIPGLLAMFLGFTDFDSDLTAQAGSVSVGPKKQGESNEDRIFDGAAAPLRSILAHHEVGVSGFNVTLGLQNITGTFVDQLAVLPPLSRPNNVDTTVLALPWGVLSFNAAGYIRGAFDAARSEMRFSMPVFGFIPGSPPGFNPLSPDLLTVPIDQTAPIVLRQIAATTTTFATYVKQALYSSGTPGYNHATLDALPYGFGCNIPGELLGLAFETSVDTLPGAGAPLFIFIEKSMRFSDVIASDLILRWAFPRWRQGKLSFSAWQVPVANNAIANLSESTKARPAGTTTNDRPTTVLSEEWQRDTITILYNRETVQQENYLGTLTFEDATAVDDSGGEGKPLTIKARNTYTELVGSGTSVEQLGPDFLALAPLFTRPFRKMTLPIGPALYEQLAPGDTVTVTDAFGRNPITGVRGIDGRAGLIIRARYNRGGAQLGSPQGNAAQGEVDVLLSPDQSRVAAYAPAALVDFTANTGGFSVGYNSATATLRCVTHEYSEATEFRDAANFVNGDKVIIVEVDPAVAGSPLLWSRTVQGVPVNDDITLNSALTSPTFDVTKRYRITYDHYAVQTAAQQQLCSQADDADLQIENLAPPFQYSAGATPGAFTSGGTTPAFLELVPTVSYGDGRALDVGHETALIRLVNNLIDYRTARHLPMVTATEITGETGGTGPSGTWRLAAWFPVHLAKSSGARDLTVVYDLRSRTGITVTMRVTLSATSPIGSTANAVTSIVMDAPRPTGDYRETTAMGNATVYGSPSTVTFSDALRGTNGLAWVWIELTYEGATRGIQRLDQGPRL